jgi:hypothetical protein
MPGFGSLVAGRKSGYAQAGFMIMGLVVSVIGAARAFTWYAANWSRVQDPQSDPIAQLTEMWLTMRWAVLGLAIFGFAWLWSLFTSLAILREAKRSAPTNVPPRLN